MRTYGQYCPIARASEFFAERWTPLIIRNLAAGCRTFTEVRDGLPGIPTALLTQRMNMLVRSGIVRKTPKPSGRGSEFELTRQGEELKQVCDVLGTWGARWLEVEPRHLDPDYALWATAKLAETAKLPSGRVVVRFEMRDKGKKRFWMILQERVEVCSSPPGFPEDLIVTTDSRCLVDVNLRRTTIAQAKKEGRLTIQGSPKLVRGFSAWFRPSPFADVPFQTEDVR